jgi:hypothetical protein
LSVIKKQREPYLHPKSEEFERANYLWVQNGLLYEYCASGVILSKF